MHAWQQRHVMVLLHNCLATATVCLTKLCTSICLAESTQELREESSPSFYETDLSLLLFLGNCSIKGLAGGGPLMQGKAWGVRYSQGCIRGLNGQRLPHLHWLSLHSLLFLCQLSQRLFLVPQFSQEAIQLLTTQQCWLPLAMVCLFTEAQKALNLADKQPAMHQSSLTLL